MEDTEDNILVMSETYPIMFTPTLAVANELTARLPQHFTTYSKSLAGVLEVRSACMFALHARVLRSMQGQWMILTECVHERSQDLCHCLHDGVSASPWLILQIIELGLIQCFNRLASSRRVLKLAESMGQGLLGAAAISDCSKMVEAVRKADPSPAQPLLLTACGRCSKARQC